MAKKKKTTSAKQRRGDEKTYSASINVQRIGVGKRLRKLRQDEVDKLAESIKRGSLLQPIVVRNDGFSRQFILVAGAHRLAAVKQLGLKTIRAEVRDYDDDHARLAEIDENLTRFELSSAERAQHTDERKTLWEKLYPETKHGAARGKAGGGKRAAKGAKLASFAEATAKATGQSKRTIKRDATRGKKVVVLPAIIGTSLDKGTELDALAKLPPEEQRQLAERAKAGEQVSAIATGKLSSNEVDPEATAEQRKAYYDAEPSTIEDVTATPAASAKGAEPPVVATDLVVTIEPDTSAEPKERGYTFLNDEEFKALTADALRDLIGNLFLANSSIESFDELMGMTADELREELSHEGIFDGGFRGVLRKDDGRLYLEYGDGPDAPNTDELVEGIGGDPNSVKPITERIFEPICDCAEGERLIDVLTGLAVATVKAIHKFSDPDTRHLFLRDMTNKMEHCLDTKPFPVDDPLMIGEAATPWFAAQIRPVFEGSITNDEAESDLRLQQFKLACARLLPKMTAKDLAVC